MWSKILLSIGFFSCASLAIISLWWAKKALTSARNAVRMLESLPTAQHSSDSRIDSLRDSLTETQDALQTLANRVKMMRVRNAANHVGELPTNDPIALKAELRRRSGLVAGQPAPHK